MTPCANLYFLFRFIEDIAIAPPEHIISAEEAAALELALVEAAQAPLPEDDEDL